MIIHCSQKLAAKLPNVSKAPLQEESSLGSWHALLYSLDRRQCVMFCHDVTRYCLFIPGLRKTHFAELGDASFRRLYLATLQAAGCPVAQIKRAELALGPVHFDTATDRSVQGSINIARRDLEYRAYEAANVMDLDPIEVSLWLNQRPVRARGKLLWPADEMLKAVAGLS